MGLEAATYVNDLTTTNPLSTDKRKQGDDHLRLIKSVLKATFPNSDKPFYFRDYTALVANYTVVAADMNKVFGVSSSGGAFQVTLPTNLGAAADGFTVTLVKLDTNVNRVTIAPTSGTLNGVANMSLMNVGDRAECVWSGTDWSVTITYAGINRVAITGNTTVDASHFDKLLDVVPASANATITLPAVATFLGRVLHVKLNSASWTCTLTPNGAETIDGAASWLLESRYENVMLMAVPGGWFVIAANGAAAGGVPIGAGMDFWGTTAPSGWLFCFGQAVSRTTYARLFARLSTTYGVGDGTTTFNLPDKRGRVSAGKDDMGGSSANRLTNQPGGLNGDTLGATGGAETHTLTIAQMPSHTHNFTAALVSGNTNTGSGDQEASDSALVTAATGGDGAHNNVQPTIVANYIIKF